MASRPRPSLLRGVIPVEVVGMAGQGVRAAEEGASPASTRGDRESVKGGFPGNRVTALLRLEERLGRRMRNHVAGAGENH